MSPVRPDGGVRFERPPRNAILIGDARRQLQRLPDQSVDMVLTSPPYLRLRDYQVNGQLGLEDHVDAWVAGLRVVVREAARVLVPTGSFWLNVADTYSTTKRQGAAKKSLLLGPERLALTLLEDGWLLRNKIVWAKPNPMPISVRDRLGCTWEALYIFVRSPQYFFDLDAIRQPHTSLQSPARARRVSPTPQRRSREAWRGPNGDDASGLSQMHAAGRLGHPLGKNPGDVWRLATSNYRGSHHATFPVALATRAIRAGCPEARCVVCLVPWRRAVHRLLGGLATRGALTPGCDCRAGREPGLVLDPFFGAGSTGVAAAQLGREWIGIELNPMFARAATQRLATEIKNGSGSGAGTENISSVEDNSASSERR